ncbi:MAG TPA: M23 family metallopeptidase [Thermoleophilaceae bacterium]|jgi:hypothetical protein|nr:M23 family metallopeptidase [Thermoleophilaceae bacterium]
MSRRLLVLPVALAGLLLAAPSARADWIWPVRGAVITPYRNGDDPYAAGQHRGIDIAADVGTPVVAATGGEVRFAGTAGSSGITVSIRTSDGLFDTSYLHLSSTAVRRGDRVSAGDRVGAVGMTGQRSAAAPHLHFGVRDAGTRHDYRDPLAYLPPPPLPGERPEPAPAPSPVGAPAPRPHALPAPRPRGVPAPQPRAAPAPRRHPHPIGRLRPEPSLRRLPVPRGAPAPAPTPAERRAPSPIGFPLSTPAPSRSTPAPSAHPAAGPDLGWALACTGLLLAAGLLGLSGDGRTATRRGHRRLAAALRPLVGRRP